MPLDKTNFAEKTNRKCLLLGEAIKILQAAFCYHHITKYNLSDSHFFQRPSNRIQALCSTGWCTAIRRPSISETWSIKWVYLKDTSTCTLITSTGDVQMPKSMGDVPKFEDCLVKPSNGRLLQNGEFFLTPNHLSLLQESWTFFLYSPSPFY